MSDFDETWTVLLSLSAVDGISNVLGDLRSNVNSTSGALKSAGSEMSNYGGAIGAGLNVAAGVMIGLGAIATVASTTFIEEASKMDTAVTQLANNMGISAKQAQTYWNAMESLTPSTGISATANTTALAAVAAQYEQITHSVLSASDALLIMKASDELANVSGDSLSDTTSTLVQVMETFHLNASQAASAANDIYTASKDLNEPVTDIAEQFSLMKSNTEAAKYSLADMVALANTMKQSGALGSGWTFYSVSQAIDKLSTIASVSALGSVVTDTGKVSTTILDLQQLMGSAEGSLNGILQSISAAGQSGNLYEQLLQLHQLYTDMQQAGTASNFPEILSKLYGAQADTLLPIVESLKNINEYEQQINASGGLNLLGTSNLQYMQTPAAMLKTLDAEIVNVSSDLGDKMLPALLQMASNIKPDVEAFAEFAEKNSGAIATILEMTIKVGLLATAFKVLEGPGKLALTMLMGFGTLDAGPMAAAAIAAGALVGAILDLSENQGATGLSTLFNEARNELLPALEDVGNFVGRQLLPTIEDLGHEALTAGGAFLGTVDPVLETLAGVILPPLWGGFKLLADNVGLVTFAVETLMVYFGGGALLMGLMGGIETAVGALGTLNAAVQLLAEGESLTEVIGLFGSLSTILSVLPIIAVAGAIVGIVDAVEELDQQLSAGQNAINAYLVTSSSLASTLSGDVANAQSVFSQSLETTYSNLGMNIVALQEQAQAQEKVASSGQVMKITLASWIPFFGGMSWNKAITGLNQVAKAAQLNPGIINGWQDFGAATQQVMLILSGGKTNTDAVTAMNQFYKALQQVTAFEPTSTSNTNLTADALGLLANNSTKAGKEYQALLLQLEQGNTNNAISIVESYNENVSEYGNTIATAMANASAEAAGLGNLANAEAQVSNLQAYYHLQGLTNAEMMTWIEENPSAVSAYESVEAANTSAAAKNAQAASSVDTYASKLKTWVSQVPAMTNGSDELWRHMDPPPAIPNDIDNVNNQIGKVQASLENITPTASTTTASIETWAENFKNIMGSDFSQTQFYEEGYNIVTGIATGVQAQEAWFKKFMTGWLDSTFSGYTFTPTSAPTNSYGSGVAGLPGSTAYGANAIQVNVNNATVMNTNDAQQLALLISQTIAKNIPRTGMPAARR